MGDSEEGGGICKSMVWYGMEIWHCLRYEIGRSIFKRTRRMALLCTRLIVVLPFFSWEVEHSRTGCIYVYPTPTLLL